MDDIKVSVIVPVYNSEKFLSKTVNSLLNQTLKEIELIFVDDGSTDNSLDILHAFSRMDNRIIILTQKNKFAGSARNLGFDYSRGEYVIFLDSDDFFKKNMLQSLYNIAKKRSLDIVVFGNYTFDSKTCRVKPIAFKKYKNNKAFSPKDAGRDIFNLCGSVPWNKLIKRELIERTGLRFQTIQNNNDEFFSRMIVLHALRIMIVNRRFVYYRVNNEESLQGGIKKNVTCFGEAIKAMKAELEYNSMLEGEVKIAFQNLCNNLVMSNISRLDSSINILKMYDYLKNDLFISCRELFDNAFLESFEKMENAIDFSVYLINYYQKEYISKQSFAYKIGKKLLFFIK